MERREEKSLLTEEENTEKETSKEGKRCREERNGRGRRKKYREKEKINKYVVRVCVCVRVRVREKEIGGMLKNTDESPVFKIPVRLRGFALREKRWETEKNGVGGDRG